MGPRFVVIIDEAHRGMRTRRDENTAVTIIQRFLKGGDEMRAAPLVLGISATPRRFNDLVAGTRTVHPVHVDAADVRASGLLKDRIVLHHSEDGPADRHHPATGGDPPLATATPSDGPRTAPSRGSAPSFRSSSSRSRMPRRVGAVPVPTWPRRSGRSTRSYRPPCRTMRSPTPSTSQLPSKPTGS